MDLIHMAVGQNADIDKLQKLFELQLAWEANQAKKAFVAAMNEFKANPPGILKNKHVHYEVAGKPPTDYDHATLDNVCKAATQGLSAHGISHRWVIEQKGDNLIRVTCILTHVAGHSEETTMAAGADETGGKNKIQAIASSVTYLERYTLLAATGLAAANTDNDGRSVEQGWDKLQEFLDSIGTAPNLEILEETFKAGFKEAMALSNFDACKSLTAAKDKKKKALQDEEEA
jgi:hypothetical protein